MPRAVAARPGVQLDEPLTALHVTHDQQEAMALADRMAVMQAARIVRISTQVHGRSCAAPAPGRRAGALMADVPHDSPAHQGDRVGIRVDPRRLMSAQMEKSA